MRTPLFFGLKIILALVALGYIGHVVEWDAIWTAVQQANPLWIGAAVALLPLNVGLETYRWHRLVRRLAPEVEFAESLGAVLSGYPIGLATPGRLGDYVGRALFLRYGGKGELAALTFAERMATLACCLVFGIGALLPFLFVHADVGGLAWSTILGIGLAVTAVFVYLLLHPRVGHRVLEALLPFERARRVLDVLDRYDRREARLLLGLSAVRYGVFSLQFVLLAKAFAPAAAWLPAAQAVALVFFAKSAIPSFTLADLGIREGAAVFFFGALGLVEAAGFNAAFLLFCVNIALPAVIGLPLMLKWRIAPEARPAEAPS
ncbi:MAG: lysylphosphatidylglycerol synthase transmembrane domain-containing protein [Rhodothermales bacterium]|nr:lysylphosphatidylglycerol synthase transmembrane domain-containing protein [Rhodothermales bacterium]